MEIRGSATIRQAILVRVWYGTPDALAISGHIPFAQSSWRSTFDNIVSRISAIAHTFEGSNTLENIRMRK
ncbi:hypothetical protein PT2222_300052 [Paraburkholderia tropica]